MIQANELRIGNWVIQNNYHWDFTYDNNKKMTGQQKNLKNWEYMRVIGVLDDGINFYQNYDETEITLLENIDPIPLTPEILEAAGFKVWNKGDCFIKKQGQAEYILFPGSSLAGIYIQINGITKIIPYVHQLQNLYHALTGQELAINLPVTAL